jgi:lipopolysaccharide transport system ATP-binding protein
MEMEFEVSRGGSVLSPWFELYNEEGTKVFAVADLDPMWRRRPRPPGRYISTAWIPGNLLSEGILFVGAGLATLEPMIKQFAEREVVAFHMIDTMEGDSARGDWAGRWRGAVRPLLKWSTEFKPSDEMVPVRQSLSRRQ